MGKLSFVAGAALGYVLGARAGRDRYEKIKEQATTLWENPKVAEARGQAADKASELAEQAGDLAKQAPGAMKNAASKVGDKVEERRGNSDVEGNDPAAEDSPNAPSRI